jgi:uncharacterized NAD(P)/FAD-binding protein YdhS
MLAAWRAQPLQGRLRITVIEPVEFGAGETYYSSQPDFLRLNTSASQVTAFPDDTVTSSLAGPRGPSLYEWYRTPHNGMAADAYPSRRDTGRYLSAVFKKMVGSAPPDVVVECLRTTAVGMHRVNENEWSIQLRDGQELLCNAVVLAVGGAGAAHADSALLAKEFGISRSFAEEKVIARPYPLEQSTPRLKPREVVGILGLGLTALDIIRACTVGRGGKFLRDGAELRYVPSGDEPQMVAWSRTGLPLMARGANQKPVDQKGDASFLTEDAIDQMRHKNRRVCGSPKLDFVRDLLPLLIREMAKAHDSAVASHSHKPKFYWHRLVWPIDRTALRGADAFKSFFVDYVRRDLADAHQGNVSNPVKSACDVIHDLRDKLRYAVEFGGLRPESHLFFDTAFTPLHNRLAVGPPPEAIEELLALVEAGIVDISCGPAPRVKLDSCSGQLRIRPYAFPGAGRELSVVVNARIAPTNVAATGCPLVRNLVAAGHIVPFTNTLNGTTYRPGGIAVTEDYRAVDSQNRAHANLFALGAITEGCTWYSQVLARPYVNSRSMRDASCVAESLWDYFAGRTNVALTSAHANSRSTGGKNPSHEPGSETTEPIAASA